MEFGRRPPHRRRIRLPTRRPTLRTRAIPTPHRTDTTGASGMIAAGKPRSTQWRAYSRPRVSGAWKLPAADRRPVADTCLVRSEPGGAGRRRPVRHGAVLPAGRWFADLPDPD